MDFYNTMAGFGNSAINSVKDVFATKDPYGYSPIEAQPFMDNSVGKSDFATGSFGEQGFGNINTGVPSFEGKAPSSVSQIQPESMGWQGQAKQEDFIPSTYESAKEEWSGSKMPWGDIAKSALDAINTSKGQGSVSSSSHRPGFRGAQIPAQQYNQGDISNAMNASAFNQAAQAGGTGGEVRKDINALLGLA